MIEPLEYKEVLQKLLEKTKAGRVSWTEGGRDQFQCELDNKYKFVVWRTEEKFGARMEESYSSNSLFFIEAEEEIYYRDEGQREMFQLLSDLFELARRSALDVPGKLASVANLLDQI